MLQTILAPIDGSALSQRALPLAIGIARRADAWLRLALVHLTDTAPDHLNGILVEHADWDAQIRRRERAYVEGLAERMRSGGAATTAALVDEPDKSRRALVVSRDRLIAAALNRHAAAINADLIVMTTHGRGGVSRMVLGSVAGQLVRRMTTPVLLVRPCGAAENPACEQGFGHVLIALDGSPLAEHALGAALALGAPDRTVYTLFRAVDPLVAEHTIPPYAVGLSGAEYRRLRDDALAYLARVAGRLRPHAVHVRTRLVVAEPARAIRDYAHEHAVDLIAMATHGRGAVARLVMGSVADQVVRSAGAPVLLVRPDPAARLRRSDLVEADREHFCEIVKLPRTLSKASEGLLSHR